MDEHVDEMWPSLYEEDLSEYNLDELAEWGKVICHQLKENDDGFIQPRYAALAKVFDEAKKRLPHGQYTAWIEENFTVSPRTARRYVQAIKDNTTPAQLHSPEPVFKSVPRTDLNPDRNTEPSIKRKELNYIERKIIEKAKEKTYQWDQRSGVIKMYIKQFLTEEEPIGRDLIEAVTNIDKFDLQEDLDQLKEIHGWLVKLEVRVKMLSHKLGEALSTKEKII